MTKTPNARGIRENSFGFLIQTLARRIDAQMRERLAELDIDVRLFANLMALAEKDGVNQRTLGATLDFPEYYTSRAVDALVKAGLAERRPDPDSRRAYLIFLTEEGRAKAAKLPKIIREVNEQFLDVLPERDRERVVELLKSVAGLA